LPMGIFRAYDIRGTYGQDLLPETALKVGQAFASLLLEEQGKSLKLAVGGDVRPSTQPLQIALESGLLSFGADVLDLGMVPTPTLYFAVAHLGLDGGAMITASHLPSKFNGIKLVKRGAVSLSYETGISKVESLVSSGELQPVPVPGTLSHSSEIMDCYWAYIRQATGLQHEVGLKVAVDSGNGSCGYFPDRLAGEPGYSVASIFKEYDGSFPNHVPDPLREENLRDLEKLVQDSGSDVGIAFDGDGDRLGIVDNLGRRVTSDQVLALLSRQELMEHRGGKIIHDVLTSKIVDDVVIEAGGQPVMTRSGHSYVNSAMLSEKALLGGEASGHIYYLDGYYGFDDASFAALKVLNLVARAKQDGKDLAQLVNELPAYWSSPEFRLPCPDEKKGQVLARLKQELESSGLLVNTLDGVRVDTDYGWGVVRASNTEPVLAMRFEGRDEASLRKIEGLFAPVLKETLGLYPS